MKDNRLRDSDDGMRMKSHYSRGMYPFKRLTVWAKAHELTLRVYQCTDGAMARRYPALASQIRRAVSAIPANIAEGSGHASQAQFNRYLEIAITSSHEAQYHLLLAKDLEAVTATEFAHLEARLSEVQAKLVLLRKRIVQNIAEQGKRGGRMASPPSLLQPSSAVKPETKAPAPSSQPTST